MAGAHIEGHKRDKEINDDQEKGREENPGWDISWRKSKGCNKGLEANDTKSKGVEENDSKD